MRLLLLFLAFVFEVKSQLRISGYYPEAIASYGPELYQQSASAIVTDVTSTLSQATRGPFSNAASIVENVVRPCSKCSPVLIPGANGNINGLPETIVAEKVTTSYVPQYSKVQGTCGPPLSPLGPCVDCLSLDYRPCGPVLIPGASGSLKGILGPTIGVAERVEFLPPSIAQSAVITEAVARAPVFPGLAAATEILEPRFGTIGPQSRIVETVVESVPFPSVGCNPLPGQLLKPSLPCESCLNPGILSPCNCGLGITENIPTLSIGTTHPSINSRIFPENTLSWTPVPCSFADVVTGPTGNCNNLPFSGSIGKLLPVSSVPTLPSPCSSITPAILPTADYLSCQPLIPQQCSIPSSVTTSITTSPSCEPTQVTTTTVIDNNVLNSLANTIQLLVLNDLLENAANLPCNTLNYGCNSCDSCNICDSCNDVGNVFEVVTTSTANAFVENDNYGFSNFVTPVNTASIASATATTTETISYQPSNEQFYQPPNLISQIASAYYGGEAYPSFGANPLITQLANRLLSNLPCDSFSPCDLPYELGFNPYNAPGPFQPDVYPGPLRPDMYNSPPFRPDFIPSSPFVPEIYPVPPFRPDMCNSPPFRPDVYPSPPFVPEVCPVPPFRPDVCGSPPFRPDFNPSLPFVPDVLPVPTFRPDICSSPLNPPQPFRTESGAPPPFGLDAFHVLPFRSNVYSLPYTPEYFAEPQVSNAAVVTESVAIATSEVIQENIISDSTAYAGALVETVPLVTETVASASNIIIETPTVAEYPAVIPQPLQYSSPLTFEVPFAPSSNLGGMIEIANPGYQFAELLIPNEIPVQLVFNIDNYC